MEIKRLIIYGAGGHARVVADAALKSGWTIVAFADDKAVGSTYIDGIKVCQYKTMIDELAFVIIAIANTEARMRLANILVHPFANIIHPSAVICSNVVLGDGNVVLANAVVQSNATIGHHCIINASVCVDHDVIIGSFIHIYPNSYISSMSKIQDGVTLAPMTYYNSSK